MNTNTSNTPGPWAKARLHFTNDSLKREDIKFVVSAAFVLGFVFCGIIVSLGVLVGLWIP